MPMPKRRRVNSSQEEDSESVSSEPGGAAAPAQSPGGNGIGTRKRRRCGTVTQEQLRQLLDAVLNHRRPDGTYLSEQFHRLPKRRANLDYYEAIQNPIDFARIQVNLSSHQYDDVSQLAADIELLVENTKQYFSRGSSEYNDAITLWNVFSEYRRSLLPEEPAAPAASAAAAAASSSELQQQQLQPASAVVKLEDDLKDRINVRLGAVVKDNINARLARMTRRGSEAQVLTGDEESEAGSSIAPISETSNWTPGELEDALEELFTAVATASDPEGRQLSTWFQLLPHKKKLPQYYEVIKQPIDLKTMAQKIQGSEYTALHELEADVLLMCRNACTFNEPSSDIYRDAKQLRRLAQSRRAEIEHARLTAAKTSERIRSKRLRGASCLSAELAQLDYDSEEEESSSDSDISEDSPLWQLFDSVRSFTTPAGYVLSEPFRTLPSRRLYPDYYEEIKNPVALRQIKRKMKTGTYSGLQAMEEDLNLMFENAKLYNPPESKLYKDALRLQKVMQKKMSELAPEFDEVSRTAATASDSLPMVEEVEDSEDGSEPPPARGTRHSTAAAAAAASSSVRRDHPVKERCKLLFRAVRDHVHEDGRQLSAVFMELPSRKLYPDYYDIIDNPIDLARIENKIRSDQYDTEAEILQDFKLMFNNCRQYNEENSVIYEDANILERILMSRVRELGPLPAHDSVRNKPRVLNRAQLLEKMRVLYNTIRDYRDSGSRQLSQIFMKLPSKLEYPDYYEVIKNPINMERICQKLKTGTYNTLDEILADFVLMFDNACKYNEPDSQIYKDSLTLHRLALQTKLQLTEDTDEVPDVRTLVQELLTSLFIATYNHQDADGRCYSDSLAELPEHDEVEPGQTRVRGISMDIIKRRLDGGLYTRLDTFQQDVCAVLERARRLSRPDSQTFEDAVEMEMFFISYRDELCRSGTLLSSPALRYTQDELKAALAKLKPEVKQDDDESQDVIKTETSGPGESMSFNQVQYRSGEFVYVDAKDKGGGQPHIVHIERLWTNPEGQQMLYGCWFFRPEETFHLQTRKFLEQEVFKSDQHIGCPLSQVVGKCCVLSVRDYFRMRPAEPFPDKDVYVCESRYSSKARAFKKIKLYGFTPAEQLVERETPLEPHRVMSVFRKRVEKHKEELAELEECEKLGRRQLPDVPMETRSGAADGSTYYQQLNVGPLLLKTGDCVYLRDKEGKQLITQIDTMWTSTEGGQFFHGPSYLTSAEVAGSPQQLFYRQEVFVTMIEDTHNMANVTGKCCVLDYNDFCSRRPTEIAESDVYVCESLYDESRRQISARRPPELRRPAHTEHVLADEIYHFRRLLVLRKQPLAQIEADAKERVKSLLAEAVGVASPVGSKAGDEDSLDGPPASVGSSENVSITTPISKKTKRPKVLTGYILYSADIRKKITSDNPAANFGDISRMVGIEWKNLTTAQKAAYEERAARLNAETAAACQLQAETPQRTPQQQQQHTPGSGPAQENTVYECNWASCDFQFQDIIDLLEHCNQEPHGHAHVYAATTDEYQCQWRGCNRIRKGALPFPNVGRLIRHLKEVHIQRNNGRILAPADRGKNFVPRRQMPASGAGVGAAGSGSGSAGEGAAAGRTPQAGAAQTPTTSNSSSNGGAERATPEPRFVTVPPRPQRLQHSAIYIRYIESLHQSVSGTGTVAGTVPGSLGTGGTGTGAPPGCGWERQLRAQPESTAVPDPARLPAAWLAPPLRPPPADTATLTKTLWHLRDYMLKDALGVSRLYEGRL